MGGFHFFLIICKREFYCPAESPKAVRRKFWNRHLYVPTDRRKGEINCHLWRRNTKTDQTRPDRDFRGAGFFLSFFLFLLASPISISILLGLPSQVLVPDSSCFPTILLRITIRRDGHDALVGMRKYGFWKPRQPPPLFFQRSMNLNTPPPPPPPPPIFPPLVNSLLAIAPPSQMRFSRWSSSSTSCW